MNNDTSSQILTSAIHALPDEYLPIKQQALKYVNNNSQIDRDWILEYKVARGCFYFGSRSYSYSENMGYFWDNDKIKSVRKNGTTLVEWTDFTDFLQDEIGVVEKKMIEQLPRDIKIL